MRPGGLVNQQPGRFQLSSHIRQFELDALEAGEALAELLSALAVTKRFFESSLRQT